MELNFSELGLERFLTQAYSQALVEGELPLPDGRKGAAVLGAEGSVTVTDTALSEGSITVEGRLRVELLCDDGEGVFAAASGAAFRHSFPVKEAASGLRAETSVSLVSLTVEAEEVPKLSAVLDVTCLLTDAAPLRVLESCRGTQALECRRQRFVTAVPAKLGEETLGVREKINAPGVERVIRAGGVCEMRSLRLGGDMALVEGMLAVNALCADGEGRLMQLQHHIPVSFELAAETKGRAEESCSASAEVVSVSLSPVDGEAGLLSVQAEVTVTLTAAENAAFDVPLAAYVPGADLEAQKEEAVFLLRGMPVKLRFGATETLQVPEGMPPCARVVSCTARPLITAAAAEDGCLRAEGLLFTRVLAETDGGTLFSFAEDIPFRAECAVDPSMQGAGTAVSLAAVSASGVGRSISLSYTLLLTAAPYALSETAVVTGLTECAAPFGEKGIVLYFAGEGEKLFDVGCRFRVPQSRLTALNPDAKETLSEGERLVLLL